MKKGCWEKCQRPFFIYKGLSSILGWGLSQNIQNIHRKNFAEYLLLRNIQYNYIILL